MHGDQSEIILVSLRDFTREAPPPSSWIVYSAALQHHRQDLLFQAVLWMTTSITPMFQSTFGDMWSVGVGVVTGADDKAPTPKERWTNARD